MTDTFDPGDRIRLTETFTSIGGAPIVSVTLTCILQDPAGVETPLSVATNLVSPSITGTAEHTIPASNASAGWWVARWVASGDIVAVTERSFYVRRSAVLA